MPELHPCSQRYFELPISCVSEHASLLIPFLLPHIQRELPKRRYDYCFPTHAQILLCTNFNNRAQI